jgi:nickel superoxide dismutase
MNRATTIVFAALLIGAAGILATSRAGAHCQIPCGIYDDAGRIATMREDVATIRKATMAIIDLDAIATAESFNQASRWVAEKDRSASNIQQIVASYFLTQRVKVAADNSPEYTTYMDQLQAFHAVMVAAMKCKQAVDPGRADTLDAAIARVAVWY